MPFKETHIPGLLVFEPKVFGDTRGYFYETYNQELFRAAGINDTFIQDNESKSVKGVLRGLHYQVGAFAQSKLVRVIEGEVLDVVVDIREGSPTYGQHFSIKLSAENKSQLYVPRGMAHGYSTLSETAIFAYKCDNLYSKASEGGVAYDDAHLAIDWQMDIKHAILSDKDKVNPVFGQHRRFY
jgi:dTDP-4-dehydrorhamnose 3,5-epimerase